MKKAIFFDLDDTLLNDKKSIQTAFDVTCGELEEQYGVDQQTIEKNVREAARNQYETYDFFPVTVQIGINPFEGLWGDFGDVHYEQFREMGKYIGDYQLQSWTRGLLKSGIDAAEAPNWAKNRFREVRRCSPFLYEETMELLEQLKNQTDYRLLLLTNGAPSLQLEKLKMTPELVPYFEHILISGNFGFGKPNPAIFEHALKLMGVSKEEVIMVGDNLSTDILGATRCEIDSIWIDHGDAKVVEGAVPTRTVQSLSELSAAIEELNKVYQ
ncbi:putative hydrolase of the HAD superfamily [Bacillus ectoiniformans]|uniref:HAD family hydrolase n=1 Tax=Bacillus ectoiniformans TaxID=1494429 RepID=UPI001958923F|nr:HAD family hydrolase [Bacillus ectoiniformans]MBM7649436.1 putative hydrolase of the HAD superfamily [Bacillus ectoiniformans]